MSKLITGPVYLSPEAEDRAIKEAKRRLKKGGLWFKMQRLPGEVDDPCTFPPMTPEKAWKLGMRSASPRRKQRHRWLVIGSKRRKF